jgi:hypothetical protein
MKALPRYQRCDFCGRSPYKVVVESPEGRAYGVCPRCWANTSPSGYRSRVEHGDFVVTRDLRKRRPELPPSRDPDAGRVG